MKIHKQGSTAMLMRVCGSKMKFYYDKDTEEAVRAFEVTQEIVQMGVCYIADERIPADKDGMVEAIHLSVGDFVVVSDKGVRAFLPDEFLSGYSF